MITVGGDYGDTDDVIVINRSVMFYVSDDINAVCKIYI
jgi:hypothetical protein